MPLPYVSIDVETTGLNPQHCQVIQFGCVIDDWKTPIDQLPTMKVNVKSGLVLGEPFALAMNTDILLQIAEPDKVSTPLVESWKLATHFAEFLTLNSYDPLKVIVAGKNFSAFDAQFLAKLTGFDPNNKPKVRFKHRVWDPAMLFVDFATDELPPDLQTCMNRAGIMGKVTHDALDDALDVVRCIRAARNRQIMNTV